MARAALLAALILGACGGGGAGTPGPPPPPPPPAVVIPFTVSATDVTAPEGENQRVEIRVTASRTSPLVDFLRPAGEDGSQFQMSGGWVNNQFDGYVVLGSVNNTGLDFEYPRDANRDNVYNASIVITDGTNTSTQTVRVTVTDVVDQARVTRVATGFVDPVAYATIPSNDTISGTFGVVAERSGRIIRVDNGGTVQGEVFLDLTGEVATQAGMGVMGVLIHDDGAHYDGVLDQELYVLMSNLDGDTELRRYHIESDKTNAIKSSEQLVLRVDYPDGSTGSRGGILMQDHNNGRVIVGVGDGGVSGAQNTFSPLGKVFRILTNGDAFPADPNRNFRIPPENPMADGAAGLPEIWAMGLRDPRGGASDFRSFDVYVADIGETMDEVNRLPFDSSRLILANFGWPQREGTNPHNGGADDPSFVRPIAQRPHTSGSTMTAGFAYYGRTELYQSEYVFGDPIAGGLFSFIPRISIFTGQMAQTFTNRTLDLVPDAGSVNRPVAIVQDANRDLFILDGDGELFKYHATWY